jgi:hypothetical protein
MKKLVKKSIPMKRLPAKKIRRARTALKQLGMPLGDYPVTGYVRIGSLTLPSTGFVDTGTKYSVLPQDLADAAGATPTGKTGTFNILKRSLRGELRRVRMSSLDGKCGGETTAFVPLPTEDWKKGVLLGAEFLQDTGMHVNDQGEAYCPVRRPASRRTRR